VDHIIDLGIQEVQGNNKQSTMVIRVADSRTKLKIVTP
jgi:hypothetical protein